jgi:peptidoglycan/LPS O-acetylase OafA/YrhL
MSEPAVFTGRHPVPRGPVATATPPAPPPRPPIRVPTRVPTQDSRRRLIGLDGMRGLAALAVVAHHCYLSAFPGYPAITGPWWAGWLVYGHFSVVIFIVLSGFSLAVSPARSGWQLGGKIKFARRRAWRILPPYWAALAFSLAIAWAIIPQPGEGSPTGKSVIVNGLLLQDITGAPTPNGAFWSIAVEAQLYVLFPLMLLLLRRGSAAVMLSLVGAVVALIGILAPSTPLVEKLLRLTPQFAVLFAMGAVAAGILSSSEWTQRLPWHWLAALAAAPVLAMIVLKGSVWTIGHFFWVDMALGASVALLLAAAGTGRPAPLLRVLDTPPLRSLGSFSYSLYLIHAPIVVVVYAKIVEPRFSAGVPAFLATLAVAGTISVIAARLFAGVFELPFQRHRSWNALRSAVQARSESARIAFAATSQTLLGLGPRAVRRLKPARPDPSATTDPASLTDGDASPDNDDSTVQPAAIVDDSDRADEHTTARGTAKVTPPEPADEHTTARGTAKVSTPEPADEHTTARGTAKVSTPEPADEHTTARGTAKVTTPEPADEHPGTQVADVDKPEPSEQESTAPDPATATAREPAHEHPGTQAADVDKPEPSEQESTAPDPATATAPEPAHEHPGTQAADVDKPEPSEQESNAPDPATATALEPAAPATTRDTAKVNALNARGKVKVRATAKATAPVKAADSTQVGIASEV